METPKKTRKRKNLHLVNEDKNADNKKAKGEASVSSEKSEGFNIELTFHADSKEALETCPNIKELIAALQFGVIKQTKDIQMLGKAYGLDLDVRFVFIAKKPGG